MPYYYAEISQYKFLKFQTTSFINYDQSYYQSVKQFIIHNMISIKLLVSGRKW